MPSFSSTVIGGSAGLSKQANNLYRPHDSPNDPHYIDLLIRSPDLPTLNSKPYIMQSFPLSFPLLLSPPSLGPPDPPSSGWTPKLKMALAHKYSNLPHGPHPLSIMSPLMCNGQTWYYVLNWGVIATGDGSNYPR